MSPHAANSLVHDLVEMAKAMETLPQVQAELEAARHDLDVSKQAIERLELKLIDKAAEITNLHSKVNSAEAGRDEAERMFLETDDKLFAFRRLVSAFSTDAASLLRAQEPQPDPVPATPEITDTIETNPVLPAEEDTSTQGQSEADPTPAPASPITTGTEPVESASEVSVPSDPTPAMESSSGSGSSDSAQHEDTGPFGVSSIQSDAKKAPHSVDPTAPSPAGDTPSPASAPIDAVATVADAPEGMADKFDGPYTGRKWSEVSPRVYSYDVWVCGGGTSENFNL